MMYRNVFLAVCAIVVILVVFMFSMMNDSSTFMEIKGTTKLSEIKGPAGHPEVKGPTGHFVRRRTIAAPDEEEGHDDRINRTVPSWAEINTKHVRVGKGGRYKPEHPSHRIVILIPYRDRRVHLKLFLDHMHPFLMRQNLDYVIYVVEMQSEGLFRKTVIMNAGFLEIVKRENASCLFFHDVDFIPTNNDNLYFCDKTVKHFAHAAQQYGYKLFFSSYIGGVIAFPVDLYRKVNGYSNVYSGWGGEDNDMYVRIRTSRVPFSRQDLKRGRYDCFLHWKQPVLANGGAYELTAAQRIYKEGLNTVNYTVTLMEERRLFTWILINTTLTPDGYKNMPTRHVPYTEKKKTRS